jgi:hypothetical protein
VDDLRGQAEAINREWAARKQLGTGSEAAEAGRRAPNDTKFGRGIPLRCYL